MHTLITSCASTRTVVPKVRVGNMPPGLTMQAALDTWLSMLNSDPPSITPREMYRGMGFTTLAKIQERFKPAGVKIVTGGLGLTDIDEKITPYDFTASPKEPENIHKSVTAEPFVQTVWWRMINKARHGKVTPICDLVTALGDACKSENVKTVNSGGISATSSNSNHIPNLTIIACSKIFLRYISDDILSIPLAYRSTIRILLAASSQGSVPAQLRPMMIPFDREILGDIPGNRNDNNHRAAFRFLELMETIPEFANLSIEQQRPYFNAHTSTHTSETSPSAYGAPIAVTTRPNLEEFLRDRPNYLTLPWEAAYKLTRREIGNVGGKMYFRAVFRKLTSSQPDVTALGDACVAKGIDALSGMSFLNNSTSSTANDHATEEATLKHLQIFIAAVRTVNPQAVFTTADVCKWSEQYSLRLGTPVPEDFSSVNKLAYIIKNNAEYLTLQPNGTSWTLAN